MDKNVQEPVKLFQYNTLGALMAGLYGGTMTVGELLEHGDLGLGTLDSIDGEFSHMHVRMIPKSTPDTKFADVATHQPEYSRDNVAGTIVGFWTPEIFHGVSVAGYHLHFISDDLTFGGHVMDFVIKEGIIEVGAVDQLDQRFPVQDRQYLFAKFNVDEMKKDIEKAE
ncbi:TPA: acetolactate decarboxylase [Streptococcus pneumoniae]